MDGEYLIMTSPESSGWKCYLFGSTDDNGFIYFPTKGNIPNWFVRFMMGICLGCKWEKIKE